MNEITIHDLLAQAYNLLAAEWSSRRPNFQEPMDEIARLFDPKGAINTPSKYPPAEPEALGREPLKRLVGVANATPLVWFAAPTLSTCCRRAFHIPVFCSRASQGGRARSRVGKPCSRGFLLAQAVRSAPTVPENCCKRQTATATPAEPGGLLRDARMVALDPVIQQAVRDIREIMKKFRDRNCESIEQAARDLWVVLSRREVVAELRAEAEYG